MPRSNHRLKILPITKSTNPAKLSGSNKDKKERHNARRAEIKRHVLLDSSRLSVVSWPHSGIGYCQVASTLISWEESVYMGIRDVFPPCIR